MSLSRYRVWHKKEKLMWIVAALRFYEEGNLFNIDYWGVQQYPESLDPEGVVLMQATGLQDKNGKTYYEGDLVKWDDEIFQVKFDKYQFVLEGFYEPRQDVPYDFFSEQEYQKAEIIGNIYENPNLLEGVK
ncbi:YopX family protein [Enterococcus sp. AZ102]|uniref:YopX family protein n=1 Tax=Enterococcus sp. AZ102 TaxID=2774865 RepID=UPI003F24600F